MDSDEDTVLIAAAEATAPTMSNWTRHTPQRVCPAKALLPSAIAEMQRRNQMMFGVAMAMTRDSEYGPEGETYDIGERHDFERRQQIYGMRRNVA